MSTLQTYEKWSARAYLDQYYSGDTIPDDSEVLISFLRRNLGDRRFGTCLDFGCGPSVYAHFAIVDRYDEVTWADYVAENRSEVQKWIDRSDDAFGWSHYARHALGLAGLEPTEAAIVALESQLRRKSAHVIPADITSTLPLGEKRSFDLVVSFFCLECVGGDVSEWFIYVRRLCSLVSSGGRLIMVALRDSSFYKVHAYQYPVTALDSHTVRNAMNEIEDLDLTTLAIEEHAVNDWFDEGFSGIILVKVDKKEQRS
ncbi:MAG: methyltransferase domain-containing protein [Fimbriimonadaceae bacterium]|nr:methyltransferase domain-containing protein [Fimbriimonadaceae bacterium]